MLQKKGIVYRHLLDRYFEQKKTTFTQLEISRAFGISLSTVNNALAPLREMGIVEIKQRGFVLCDVKKLIIYFATVRDIARDQVYATRYGASAAEIEKLMPSDAVFTAFSAFRLTFKEAPSDYSEVYVYANAEALGEIRKRFPQKNGPPNVVVFEADGFISKGKVSIAQIFADLWNLKSWYAKEYLDALERRLFG